MAHGTVGRIPWLSPLNLLSNPDWTWLATVLADVWKTTPFITLLLLAASRHSR